MGTDIHLAAEIRIDGRWQYRKTFLEFEEQGYDRPQDPTQSFYLLLEVLAGVRKGYGYTGEPLFEGRGLPEDIDKDAYLGLVDRKYTSEEQDNMPDLGDYSFTWASFEELRDSDWKNAGIKTC